MNKKIKKDATLFDALLCIGFLVAILVTCLVVLKDYEISAHIPLIIGGIFTAFIAIVVFIVDNIPFSNSFQV